MPKFDQMSWIENHQFKNWYGWVDWNFKVIKNILWILVIINDIKPTISRLKDWGFKTKNWFKRDFEVLKIHFSVIWNAIVFQVGLGHLVQIKTF